MRMLSRYTSREISEINVTPFVDVLLILLVIFMITAPVITKDIKISIPKEKLEKVISSTKREFIIDLDRRNRIYYNGKRKNFTGLTKNLKEFLQNGGQQVFIRADRSLKYHQIIKLMAFVQNLGFQDIGLLVQDQ